ncbi:MAG: BrnA antitoxin family protein [Pseudomonadota bacterium]
MTNDQILRQKQDNEIDLSDAPEWTESMMNRAKVIWPEDRPAKQQLTIRLDPDIVAHFREEGRGYQTRINAVLRAYVDGQKTTG